MKFPDYFISCDWGTTNFRLKVVESSSLNIMQEINSPIGIKRHFLAYQKQDALDQYSFFEEFLSEQVASLPVEHQQRLIIASGMITANIGMYELPYSEMPIAWDGKSLFFKELKLSRGNKALLISGVKAVSGMMRGEETQAIGLADFMDTKKGLLLLPGTHSKHLTFDNNQFTALSNFMTGELFEVLATKSILQQSVESSAWEKQYEESFLKGVEMSLSGNLNAQLLSIRANQVLNNSDRKENYFQLSGIVIGSELAYLKDCQDAIFLAAPDSLTPLYSLALSKIIDRDNWQVFDTEEAGKALLMGQVKIVRRYAK